MFKEPIFIENSKVPVFLSKFTPITISAIALGFVVFSRGEITPKTRRHETIHYKQYLETLFIGFILIYFFDFLWASLVKRKGFSRESYLAIRFEQEAHHCDDFEDYLENRKLFSWLGYKLGGE